MKHKNINKANRLITYVQGNRGCKLILQLSYWSVLLLNRYWRDLIYCCKIQERSLGSKYTRTYLYLLLLSPVLRV